MSVSERQAGEGIIDRGKDTEVCQSVMRGVWQVILGGWKVKCVGVSGADLTFSIKGQMVSI